MFAACILFALPTIKEAWVKADTHPVYNKRVEAILVLNELSDEERKQAHLDIRNALQEVRRRLNQKKD
jgi:hypothetical protein